MSPVRVQARSRQTRARILDAAEAVLIERGVRGWSTVEVCRRAGVSRGSLLHQFPTSRELALAAVRHSFEKRGAELARARERRSAAPDDIAAEIDALWEVISGPAFGAWVDLVAAARVDPELREAVAEMSAAFAALGMQLFDSAEASMLVFALINGLMLDRVLGLNDELVDAIRGRLPALARLVQQGEQTSRQSRRRSRRVPRAIGTEQP